MNEKIPGKLRDLQQDSVFMSLRKMSQIIHETERGRTDMRSQSSKNSYSCGEKSRQQH